jgi:HB1, ASXL, restriction endonuclease HTH domain
MSTLAVVEEILRETAVPMSVREIVERAGARLPSKSKTPDTVVARDLSMDIKRKGESSSFVRSSPGRYTLRALLAAELSPEASTSTSLSSVLRSERATAMPARKPVHPQVPAQQVQASAAQPSSEDGFAG